MIFSHGGQMFESARFAEPVDDTSVTWIRLGRPEGCPTRRDAYRWLSTLLSAGKAIPVAA